VRPLHRLRLLVILAIIFCFLALRIGIGHRLLRMHAAASAAAAPSTTPVATSATATESIDFAGRTRAYLLHVAPTYAPGKDVPLVLVLHGATQSPENIERMSGMSSLADELGFIAVYPRGTGRIANIPTWNSGNCCGYAQENKIDDVGFIRALIEKLEAGYSIDRRRIFVTGISNGAMMSFRLGCEMSDTFAAIAPVEGAQNLPCHPSNPVSVIVFHGTDDHLVPYDGGATPFQIGPRRSDTPVSDTVAFWVNRDHCSPTASTQESPSLHVSIYSGCADQTGVSLYAIQGGHHIWPGVKYSGNEIPATTIMWDFFMRHPKP
jgi:polyhydroxybutyrate depolymerase